MTIYLDLVFLSNFLLDYSFIVYTGIISRSSIKIWRIFLASLFATLSLVLFLIELDILFYILRILWSLLIILIAFNFDNIKQYIKKIIIFYFLNYLTAGIIISYNFQIFENSIMVDLKNSTSWILLIISFILANLITYIYKVIVDNKTNIIQKVVDIKFEFLSKEYYGNGLIDSGNVVYSKVDHLPIIFIDREIIDFNIDEELLIKHNIKFTYVRYKTVKDNCVSLTFKPEFFYVKVDKDFLKKDVYIAISNNIKSYDHTFNVILNANILI